MAPAKKQTKAKSKTKTKMKPIPKPPKMVRKPTISRALIPRVCGLVNPFCKAAVGAKYPDDSAAYTLPYSYRRTLTISTDANGNGAFMLTPTWGSEVAHTSLVSITSTTITWTNAIASFAPIADVKKFRIVSAGFKLNVISAPLTTTGMLRCRTLPIDVGILASDQFDGAAYRGETMDIALKDVKDVGVISQHTSAMPQTFYDPSTATLLSDTEMVGLNPTTIFIEGGPASTAVLDVQLIIHYELQFNPTSATSQLASPAPPASSLITQAANRLTSTIPSFFERVGGYLATAVERKAAQAIASLVGGPVGSIAGAGIAAITVD